MRCKLWPKQKQKLGKPFGKTTRLTIEIKLTHNCRIPSLNSDHDVQPYNFGIWQLS